MKQLAEYIKDRKTLGLMQAILIGDEVNLDNDLRQAYSETGIVHIIAISGSHITFFFLLLSFLMTWLRHKKYHWIKYLAALPLIWIYVVMAGAPPSAVRAAIMFTVLSIGFVLEKQPNMLNNLLATAFVLLCAEPMWLYAVGFQLSFVAVLSLILFYRPIFNWLKPTHLVVRGLWGAIAASIGAELLVAPLAIYYFHLFPLLFVVANIFAYMFMSVVIVFGMLIVALSSFVWLAGAIATLATFLVVVFNDMVYSMQKLNPDSFRFLCVSRIELALVYIVIGAFAVWFLKQRKAALFTALSAMCVLMVCLCADECNVLRQRRLIAYNILRADHIELIEGKQHAVLHTTDTTGKGEGYILKPAHTGLHAWRQNMVTLDDVAYINGRRVLILDHDIYTDSSFHADDIIISYPAKAITINSMIKQYSPERIVLSNSVKYKELQAWTDSCKTRNLSLHIISKDGAFIL